MNPMTLAGFVSINEPSAFFVGRMTIFVSATRPLVTHTVTGCICTRLLMVVV